MSLDHVRLEDLFAKYDAFLIDQFGVLMSGDGPYRGAGPALDHLARLGKRVIILSNSGKRSEPNCARLVGNGFARAHFETVLSSGEVAHHNISTAIGGAIAKEAKVLVLIKGEDPTPVDDLDLARTDDPEKADLLLIVSRDPACPITFYQPILKRLAARKVPGICVNPDMTMLIPEGQCEAAGHLARIFEDMGGQVDWYGKPYGLIYERAKALLGPLEPDRVLCIGDSLSHDIAGGRAAGFKTALVRTGIHADLDDIAVVALMSETGNSPDHVVKAFALQ